MIEERFDRIEGMLTQLIQVVGNLNTAQQEMLKRQDSMEKRLDSIEKRMDSLEKRMDSIELRMDLMENKSEERHQAMMEQIKTLELDQDFIWEKAAKGEREIELLKKRLGN